ncbi:MAG: MGMT family protein [Bacteroidales bacterium]|nr:MGMT family protein [Bacteroidales bacterium]
MDESFFSRVWEVVRQVPSGRVTSYGAIARFLGAPQSARMVGWAMNQSHTCGQYVPAHRVVNRQGMLTGKHHFDGPNVMVELLSNEGVRVVNNQVVDFRSHFWDPRSELGL